MSAALSGAVDLSGLKARADAARQQPAGPQGDGAPSAPPSAGGNVVEVTEATFQDFVERSMQQLLIVDLWAAGDESSSQLSSVLGKLADESNGAWVLGSIDVAANQRIAQLFGVQSLPTVVAIAGGQPVDAFSGALPEPQVREWIGKLLDALREQMPSIRAAEEAAGAAPEEVEDPRFTEAEDAFERGDYAEAEAAYARILDSEPANEQAKAALVQVRFTARAGKVDPTALERAEADPADLEAQLGAADLQVAQGQVAEGFARLIAAVRRTAGEERNKVREHLVGLFELFDPSDERVAKARRDLASALF